MSDLIKRLRGWPGPGGYAGVSILRTMTEAANKIGDLQDEIEKLRAALQAARRDALEEAARRIEIMWLMFREKDNGASDWIFRAHDDIPTGDDFVAAIRALGEKG
jgi:hypothetical protein